MSLPQRGEVWLVDLGMAAKVRPALVLSVPFGDRDYALFHIVPHTTAPRGSQFEVALKVPWLQPGAFNVQGSQSIAHARFVRRLGVLSSQQVAMVEDAFRRWLGLSSTPAG
jgi:mRNA interferase MazF